MEEPIAALFRGWDKALILSCLQGLMGYTIADDASNPSSGQLVIGDFCFFAGKADRTLARQAAAPILVPQNEEWGRAIEDVWGDRVEKHLRYAIQKEARFDTKQLAAYAQPPSPDYALRLFDRDAYELAMQSDWSRDFCSQFADYPDYSRRGLGVAAFCRGELVAGASSYVVYRGGIEIEIDTHPDFRRRGLALACGAGLILACLERGLAPRWDAHDLRSVALAERLGYRLDGAYPVYLKAEPPHIAPL